MKDEVKKGQLQKLSKKHHRAIDLLILGSEPDYIVANLVDVDPATLCRWKKSPVFSEEYDRRLKEADDERKRSYRARANAAAERLLDLTRSGNPTVALGACKEILRLAGDGPDEGIRLSGGGVVLLPEVKQ